MKKVLVGLLVILFLVPAVTFAKKDKDLMGTYTVMGYNPGETTSGEPSYSGTLDISQSGGAYMLKWNLNTGKKKTYNGVGIYSDGVLSVGYEGGGVVSYKVEKDTLKGVWAPADGGVFGYEFCQKR